MKERFLGILFHWAPLGFSIVGVCALVYALAPQTEHNDATLHVVVIVMAILLVGSFLLDVLGDAIRRRMMARAMAAKK